MGGQRIFSNVENNNNNNRYLNSNHVNNYPVQHQHQQRRQQPNNILENPALAAQPGVLPIHIQRRRFLQEQEEQQAEFEDHAKQSERERLRRLKLLREN
eukprot:UN26822